MFFSPIVDLRIIFVTGMINLIAIAMVLLSCRCINTWKISKWINKYAWFKRYFKWHCFLWYVLLPSLIIHVVFALRMVGVPF